jgi:hypothetical protein
MNKLCFLKIGPVKSIRPELLNAIFYEHFHLSPIFAENPKNENLKLTKYDFLWSLSDVINTQTSKVRCGPVVERSSETR